MNLELNEFQKNLLEKSVLSVEYKKLGQKTTVAFVTAVNGFELVGTSGCVNPKDFDFEIGKHFALVDALTQLGKFEGYYRQQMNHVQNYTINIVNNITKEDASKMVEEIAKGLKRQYRK